MIRSFRCKETEKIFHRQQIKKFSGSMQRRALRKLVMLNAAESLEDLSRPPGNRLEALTGDRQGQYSIRINDQFRVCFVWREGHAYEVEIIDYH